MLRQYATISWRAGEKFTTKSTKATKANEKAYQDFFVSFVLRLISWVAADSCTVISDNPQRQ
jgi:hypothetical protein